MVIDSLNLYELIKTKEEKICKNDEKDGKNVFLKQKMLKNR